MDLSTEQLMVLEVSALLHDLGMLAVPETLLSRPGPLAEGEYEAVKKHPQIGKEMIEGIPFLEKAIPDVFHHHEKFDGAGYPEGLSGTGIPLASRILAVVDAFEAMTHGRPYRDRLDVERAIEEIRQGAGSQFDPKVVASLEKLRESGRLPVIEGPAPGVL
jgi:HD-GYP domain-containing protein (c-di-GMP phosphodiesterase class II)